jgi:beta-glucosidase
MNMVSCRINGVPACANKKLLTDILRKEWGFNGFVVSDAGAIKNIVHYHKYTKTLVEAAVDSVKAGCNMELTGATGMGVAYFNLLAAVKNKQISEEELRENLKAPMYARMVQGEFDPVDMNPYSKIDMSVVLSKQHLDMAVKASAMSFVLMKNLNNYLPIKKRFDRLAVSSANKCRSRYTRWIYKWFIIADHWSICKQPRCFGGRLHSRLGSQVFLHTV